MKKGFLVAVALVILSSCDGESECESGKMLCDGNLFRMCVYGEWSEVYCENAAPVCNPERGCQEASSTCGNDAIETGEECDGTAHHGKTCASVNAALVGTPICQNCRLDYTVCTLAECQNGQVQCADAVLQLCSDNVWSDVMNCAEYGQVCDDELKKCQEL